ncbi:hypothetical protein KC368_g21 [Hortaea werneckii]|nr:hypothetical protein KC368_g21 [Hortaea werneckii]
MLPFDRLATVPFASLTTLPPPDIPLILLPTTLLPPVHLLVCEPRRLESIPTLRFPFRSIAEGFQRQVPVISEPFVATLWRRRVLDIGSGIVVRSEALIDDRGLGPMTSSRGSLSLAVECRLRRLLRWSGLGDRRGDRDCLCLL